jgi:acetolactate synthase-1/2/3 large subunit
VRSDGTRELRALLDATGIPATATPNARGVIPRLSPCHIGSGGILGGTAVTLACGEADLIVGIGCKFSSFLPVNKPPAYPVPAGQRIVQVDIDAESLGRNVPLALGRRRPRDAAATRAGAFRASAVDAPGLAAAIAR